MDVEHFKFGCDRCLSVWIIHGSAFAMILLIGASLLFGSDSPDYGNLALLLVFLAIIFGPHTFLFVNHLKHERQTEVILTTNQISIIKDNARKNFQLEDIIKVEEYEASKTPWMIIVKWRIVSSHDEITLSSITFPRTKAWHFFGTKIDRKVSFFPMLS